MLIPLRELLPYSSRGLGMDLTPAWEDDGDPMLGTQFVSTTKTGTTVFSKRVSPPIERRVGITSAVEELEFLVNDQSIPERALLQKLRAARRALMGSSSWSFASYADPRRRYDAYSDLNVRLDAVQADLERRLGYQLTGRAMLLDE